VTDIAVSAGSAAPVEYLTQFLAFVPLARLRIVVAGFAAGGEDVPGVDCVMSSTSTCHVGSTSASITCQGIVVAASQQKVRMSLVLLCLSATILCCAAV
jgi:hypothetical protein